MIDIVVTYVYERDKQWAQEFKYWKEREILEHKSTKDNRQAFGVERTREWDTFKYWFRGIEQNCTWVNKIFLIVQNKNHIPKWLNKDKVRIVYHDEYIPKELLPTFNAMTICCYASNIKDLSNNYIMCDDDFYFLNPIEKDRFFKDGKPIHLHNEVNYEYFNNFMLNLSDGVFYSILNNDLEFTTKLTNKRIKYGIYHLPEARLKSFEQEIIHNNEQEFENHFIGSKFRSRKNLCHTVFSDLLKLNDKVLWGDPYKNCCYCALKSNVNFNNYWNKDIVCFNDTEQLDDFNFTKKKFIDFLEKKFPNKSSYEV